MTPHWKEKKLISLHHINVSRLRRIDESRRSVKTFAPFGLHKDDFGLHNNGTL